MAGSRRQRCHRLSRGAADLAVLLFTQPLGATATTCGAGFLAGVENLWRARKCWKARQAGAISGEVSVKSFSAAVQFHPRSALNVLVDGGRVWKKGSRGNLLSPKASMGTKRRGQDYLHALWQVLAMPQAQGLLCLWKILLPTSAGLELVLAPGLPPSVINPGWILERNCWQQGIL